LACGAFTTTAAADIDTLCVCPRHVTRADFFNDFFEMLKKESDVTELSAVPDAYVPVIKFKFANIEVCCLFCPLPGKLSEQSIEETEKDVTTLGDNRSISCLPRWTNPSFLRTWIFSMNPTLRTWMKRAYSA